MRKQLKIATELTLNPITQKMNQSVLKCWRRHGVVKESGKGRQSCRESPGCRRVLHEFKIMKTEITGKSGRGLPFVVCSVLH